MPIYAYRCRSCDARFEELVRGDAAPPCPRCGVGEPERVITSFAAPRPRGDAFAAVPFGAAGSGCCGGRCAGH